MEVWMVLEISNKMYLSYTNRLLLIIDSAAVELCSKWKLLPTNTLCTPPSWLTGIWTYSKCVCSEEVTYSERIQEANARVDSALLWPGTAVAAVGGFQLPDRSFWVFPASPGVSMGRVNLPAATATVPWWALLEWGRNGSGAIPALAGDGQQWAGEGENGKGADMLLRTEGKKGGAETRGVGDVEWGKIFYLIWGLKKGGASNCIHSVSPPWPNALLCISKTDGWYVWPN